MFGLVLKVLVKVASSKVMEDVIAIAVDKLLQSQSEGIGKDLSKTMINGIIKSKRNPTKEEIFKDALELL